MHDACGGFGKDNVLRSLQIRHNAHGAIPLCCGGYTTSARKHRDRTNSCFWAASFGEVIQTMWSLDTHVWSSRYILDPVFRATKFSCSSNQLSTFNLAKVSRGRAVSMLTALGGGMRSPSTLATQLGSATALRCILIAAMMVLGVGDVAAAQGYESMQPMATRADLTAMADRLGRGSESDRTRASLLRARLRDGDFQPGDRIRLVIDGSVTQDDTLPVGAGSKIRVKEIGEISLAGVLRSELQGHLTKELSRYIKDVRVQATPLVRLAILGPVGKPGYFYMPSDIAITDAIMRAGGPSGAADLKKSVIRRNTKELYDSRNTRTALNEGLTLDQLSLRDGDSIEVGEKTGSNWQKIASIVGVASTLVWALSYGFSRR
jgi:protein involved in polysaccharide export with SLBB domain